MKTIKKLIFRFLKKIVLKSFNDYIDKAIIETNMHVENSFSGINDELKKQSDFLKSVYKRYFIILSNTDNLEKKSFNKCEEIKLSVSDLLKFSKDVKKSYKKDFDEVELSILNLKKDIDIYKNNIMNDIQLNANNIVDKRLCEIPQLLNIKNIPLGWIKLNVYTYDCIFQKTLVNIREIGSTATTDINGHKLTAITSFKNSHTPFIYVKETIEEVSKLIETEIDKYHEI